LYGFTQAESLAATEITNKKCELAVALLHSILANAPQMDRVIVQVATSLFLRL
jgi:hypothetical protein